LSEPKSEAKSFVISKQAVWDAYRVVRANQGAAGVDEQSIADFEVNLKANLYKIWNRMSSGSYMPPPVRQVEIPKRDGKGQRVLGVPTVGDRIAQTVVKMALEPKVEPLFHPDSYAYRQRRSALDAVGTCRQRCWRNDWVVDLDIKSFFDTLDHSLVMKAVSKHTDERWILLYIERWLKAPLQQPDGTLVERDRGSPQGSAISPLLANIFMHHAFDLWMSKNFPLVPFERYSDDVVLHCKTERQANEIKDVIAQRLRKCCLDLHPDKTTIVYCKDDNRKGSHEHQRFDFLGYTFRTRLTQNRRGERFVGFSPAISGASAKAIRHDIRRWRLHLRSGTTLRELASMINVIVTGWDNYYGRFYRSMLHSILMHINDYLVRWAMRKFKRLRRSRYRAWKWLFAVARREPDLFAHWRLGARPHDWAIGAG